MKTLKRLMILVVSIFFITSMGSIAWAAFTITSPNTLPEGTQGVPYSYQIQTSGGKPQITFQKIAGNLPPGVTLNSSGLISGTPTAQGTYAFTVKATDSSDPKLTAAKLFSLKINPTSKPKLEKAEEPIIIKPKVEKKPTGPVYECKKEKMIENVKISNFGTWVSFEYTTEEVSKGEIWISENAPQRYSSGGLIVKGHSAGDVYTNAHYSKKIKDLEPDHKYYYLIRAIDQGSVCYFAKGEFRTKKRVARINVFRVEIHDDSDDNSAGECQFGFFLNPDAGTYGEKSIHYPKSGTITCDTGKTIEFGSLLLEKVGAGETLVFNATGFDDDESDVGFSKCGKAPIGPMNYNKSNECGDSAGKNKTFQLGKESIHEPFKLWVNGKLRFTVYGRVDVGYIE